MKRFLFFNRAEVAKKKHENGYIQPTFSLTCENVGKYVKMLDLNETYIFTEE